MEGEGRSKLLELEPPKPRCALIVFVVTSSASATGPGPLDVVGYCMAFEECEVQVQQSASKKDNQVVQGLVPL